LFAFITTILLEFACRVCKDDTLGNKLPNFSQALKNIEPRYFLPLPGKCRKPGGEFTLPGPNPDSHLLAMLFDLIRNGKAHQYQSAILTLSGGDFDVSLTGALPSRSLLRPNRRRSRNHLTYKVLPSGDLSVYVRTDQFFLDIKHAIQNSRIIHPTDVLTDVRRPQPGSSLYAFPIADLKNAFVNGGLKPRNW